MIKKMKKNVQSFTVNPSLLSCNLSDLKTEVEKVEIAGADGLHIDVMDGHFVPNLTFGPWIVDYLSQMTHLPLDVHLMVDNPETQWKTFAQAGAHSISVHYEAVQDFSILNRIKKYGIFSGLAIKPKTSVESIFSHLNSIDFVVIMTVEPGFSGQKFIESSALKIKSLRQELDRQKTSVKIEIDGGVSDQTVQWLNGADILVSGHYIFRSGNYRSAISRLKGMVNE